MSFSENVSLAPLTTLHVGGSARYFAEFSGEEALEDALRVAGDQGLPIFLLGGGSNIVISQNGFAGLVLSPQDASISVDRVGDAIRFTAGAGVIWDDFVRFTVERNVSGIECLAGIPGLVGGTPVQNVGAYGQEVSETIYSVRAYDRTTGDMVVLSNAECRFGYRRSRFNHNEPGRWIILAVEFRLHPDGKPTLKYADLKNYFGPEATPSLLDTYHAVRAIRAKKGMVLDATDPDTRSAGSFFKNPALTVERFARLEVQMQARGIVGMARYPQEDGTIKAPAAFLIEKSGLQRGQTFCDGRVGLSTKHILALTNRGGATGEDIAQAAREVQARVHDTWGILLAPEPVFVGFPKDALLPEIVTRA